MILLLSSDGNTVLKATDHSVKNKSLTCFSSSQADLSVGSSQVRTLRGKNIWYQKLLKKGEMKK